MCWGHDTGVLEANVRDFSGNWTGTGSIQGAGDAEEVCLDVGEYMDSEVVNTGTYNVTLLQNNYAVGDDATMWYRHGATSAACQAAAWNLYVGNFVSLGYVQVRLEHTQPLRQSSSNGRYFEDASGNPVYLTGSHTWDNRQDQDAVGDFDWDTYMSNLGTWNHNFIRLWVWEQPKNIGGWPAPENPASTLSPEVWLRTGPGNAADGGLKFDLSQYNSDHFDRLRERCIDAWEQGIYVSVMLFNGWSIALKSLGNNPFVYHAMEDGNNINSVDGDTNDDGDGYETENDSIAAVTTYQKAYIDEVLSYVDDLDNVIYEICNEADGTVADTEDWVDTMIAYVQANSDHPVWNTVLWPGGDNNYLLGANAEAISPNSDISKDGTKVVIHDSDHEGGIAGSADWAWKMFTGGAGGIAYMDSYNNDWIDGSGSGHPDQTFRNNMGYILTWADTISLLDTVPQGGGGSPCSTGYCLYDAGLEYICYQDDSGDFTLDLTGYSGTYDITWRRVSDGSTDTDTTTGGGNRTLSPPWAGLVAALVVKQ